MYVTPKDSVDNVVSDKIKNDIEKVKHYYKEKVLKVMTKADENFKQTNEIKKLYIEPFDINLLANSLDLSDEVLNQYVQLMREILISKGFFTICNHGVSNDLIQRVVKHSRAFFNLNTKEKQQYITESSTIRGWTQPSQTRYSKSGEVMEVYKEALHFGPDFAPYDLNVWPNDSDFKNDILKYYSHMERIENILLKIIALTFKKNPDFLTSLASPHKGLLRLNYFNTMGINSSIPSVSFGGHTDWGTITILYQEKPGLEVVYNDEWYAIYPEENHFVVNIGDLMSLWSNGKYVSTVHRARHQNGESRISIPYFGGHSLHPDDRTMIYPIVNKDELPEVDPTTFYDHITTHYNHFDKIVRV